MLDRLKREWKLHVKANILVYLLISFIFITGIMAGTFTVISLPAEQKVKLNNFIQEFFNSQGKISIDRWAIFKESFWQHFLASFLIWLFGLFIWGSPFILAIMGIRGFYFGFTIGFMIERYKFAGLLFSSFCLLPQTVIYVFCYGSMAIISAIFSFDGIGRGKGKYIREQKRSKIAPYTMRLFLIFLVLLFGILIEVGLSPLLFPLFAWIFK